MQISLRHRFSFLFSLFLFGSFLYLHSAPVSLSLAELFAQRWLSSVERPLSSSLSAADYSISGVSEILSDDGSALLAYHVALEPSGYLLLAADDRIQPVISFSADGIYDDAPANPLRKLLALDLGSRLTAVNELAPETAPTRGAEAPVLPEAVQENKAAWGKFTAPPTRAAETEVVAELWVDVLLESTWGQAGGIYNYYTPKIYDDSYSFQEHGDPDNIVAGCVATANA